MPFLSKTILKNCLFLFKYPILAVYALGEIQNFQNSSKKSFITSTTGKVHNCLTKVEQGGCTQMSYYADSIL